MVSKSPEWKKPQKSAQYFGSANQGLGFLHVEVSSEEDKIRLWDSSDNHGVLTIEEGDMEQKDILQNLMRMFDKEWQWKLKPMDEYRYLVRFPPNKRVDSIAMGDVIWFPLNKEGVMASLKVCDGEIKPIGKLEEVWVQVRGIPPKWSKWEVLQQVPSSLGKLIDVDWYSLFSNQFAMVRLKLKCKDPCRIPRQRVLEIQDEHFLLNYRVEGFKQQNLEGKKDDGDEDGDDNNTDDEDDLLKEDLDDINGRVQNQSVGGSKGSRGEEATPKTNLKGGQTEQNKNQSKTAMMIDTTKKSVERMMETGEIGEVINKYVCINLLKAMELDDKEDEEEEGESQQGTGEDQEPTNLPEEWIYAITKEDTAGVQKDKRGTSTTESNLINLPAEVNQKTKVWGPIQAERRSSRLNNDDKTILEKAKNLKRKINLEDNKGIKSHPP
jgi:hypothetical protein